MCWWEPGYGQVTQAVGRYGASLHWGGFGGEIEEFGVVAQRQIQLRFVVLQGRRTRGVWRILRGGEAKNDDKGYAEVCGFPLTLSISSGWPSSSNDSQISHTLHIGFASVGSLNLCCGFFCYALYLACSVFDGLQAYSRSERFRKPLVCLNLGNVWTMRVRVECLGRVSGVWRLQSLCFEVSDLQLNGKDHQFLLPPFLQVHTVTPSRELKLRCLERLHTVTDSANKNHKKAPQIQHFCRYSHRVIYNTYRYLFSVLF